MTAFCSTVFRFSYRELNACVSIYFVRYLFAFTRGPHTSCDTFSYKVNLCPSTFLCQVCWLVATGLATVKDLLMMANMLSWYRYVSFSYLKRVVSPLSL